MIRLIYLILCLSLSTSCLANQVYTWLDDNGVRHFSDNAIPSHSTDIELMEPAIPRVHSPAISTKVQKSDLTSKTPPTLSIVITSPTNGETIRNNNGEILVYTELNRPLTMLEQLQLLINGQPYGAPSTKTVWHLKNVDRGTHRFSIQVVGSGKVIASSSIVTVYLHRASVN